MQNFASSMKEEKKPSLLKQVIYKRREKIFILRSFFSDNKVGNLLGLTLKVSNRCIHQTAHYSSRWLLLTLPSHLLSSVPLVLQSSSAYLAHKDQNVILKWQNL